MTHAQTSRTRFVDWHLPCELWNPVFEQLAFFMLSLTQESSSLPLRYWSKRFEHTHLHMFTPHELQPRSRQLGRIPFPSLTPFAGSTNASLERDLGTPLPIPLATPVVPRQSQAPRLSQPLFKVVNIGELDLRGLAEINTQLSSCAW